MHFQKPIWLLFLLPFLFLGCNDEPVMEKPEDLIPEDAYIDLIAELQLIKSHYSAEPDEVDLDSLKQEIYQKYEINEEQFISSNRYYQQQVSAQINRIDQAMLRLQEEQTLLQSRLDSLNRDSTAMADSTLDQDLSEDP